MKKRSGLYPSVQADAAASGVVSQAGGVVLLETVRASGLDVVLREALSQLDRTFEPTGPRPPGGGSHLTSVRSRRRCGAAR